MLALQPDGNKDKRISLSTDSSHVDDRFQRELQEFQKIQRESEYLRLKIKNKALMNELGIKDREDIFADSNEAVKKETILKKKVYLLSTFKSGKGPEKARIFIPGLGTRIMKQGDFIIDNMRIMEIKNGRVKIIVMPEGNVINIDLLNPF